MEHGARLLRVLLWSGVGLAAVAAVLALAGGSTTAVRLAVLLVAVCVVLIGAAALIRHDPVLLRRDVEDRVAEEVDALRAELRSELTGNAALTGRVHPEVPRRPAAVVRAAASVTPIPHQQRGAGSIGSASVAPPRATAAVRPAGVSRAASAPRTTATPRATAPVRPPLSAARDSDPVPGHPAASGYRGRRHRADDDDPAGYEPRRYLDSPRSRAHDPLADGHDWGRHAG